MTSRSSILLVFVPIVVVATASLSIASPETGSHWGNWRGPVHTGEAPDADPPIRWSESNGVAWKIALPGRGLASPVVWDDRVFVLAAEPVDRSSYEASQGRAEKKREREEWPPSVDPVKHRFLVIAVSRDDGRELWRRVAAERVPHESHYLDASWANASPVTDGERVVAHFGSNGTYAYDLEGNPLWQVDLGDMTTRRGFGEGSSPALHGDTVVINWDHEGDSFVVALDADTGEQRWRTERPDEVTSWSTPVIVRHGDRKQIVIAATGKSRGYDLETGRELWRLGGMTTNTIPTPVPGDGLVYLASGYRGNMLQAVALAGAGGDLEQTEAVRWFHDRDTPYVPSLLLTGGRIYMIKHFRNILSVLDAGSGDVRYQTRLPDLHDIWASPVAADGRVYVFDRDGHALVLRDGDRLDVIATNVLDEGADASPAIVGGDLFLRTTGHLYRIGGADEPASGESARVDRSP